CGCGRCGRRGWRPDDLRSPGGGGVRRGAGWEAALAFRLTRLFVERVGVERVPVVGHLQGAVAAPRRAQKGLFDAGAGGWLPRDPERRPEPCATSATGALPPPVLREQVEGVAPRVHENHAELCLPKRDGRVRSRVASDRGCGEGSSHADYRGQRQQDGQAGHSMPQPLGPMPDLLHRVISSLAPFYVANTRPDSATGGPPSGLMSSFPKVTLLFVAMGVTFRASMPVTHPTRERPEATWELVLKRNPVERLKREKAPLGIRDELPALIAAGYENVPEEDIVRLQWWGLYHDKPKIGTFMLRIKLP